MYRLICWLVLTIVCGRLLAACGGQAARVPGAPAVGVTASEFRFSPATLTIAAGQPTTLNFKNAGQTLHDFTIVSGPGIATPAASADGDQPGDTSPYHVAAEAGKQATLTLDLPAGTYTFICSVQGHKDLGMQGTLTVR